MLKHLLNTSVTIYNESTGEKDEYNNDVPGWQSYGVFRGRVDPAGGSEQQVDRDTRTSNFKLILEERADGIISPLSRVKINGVMYDVQDTSTYYRRVSVSHVEATIRLIEG